MTGNELTPDQAMAIMDLCAELPYIRSLKLGLNCYGSQFQSVTEYIPDGLSHIDFVDFGEEE